MPESGKKEELVELLRGVPILSGLEDDALKSLIGDASEGTFSVGQTIFKDWSYLAELYIMIQGRVEVRKRGALIAKLSNGQLFREMAFLNDSLPHGAPI
jgi:signal-transduction protein with cAMP-binding, CBS, and nucleotidyltransferase domain